MTDQEMHRVPFATTLQQMDRGKVHTRLTDAMAEMVAAVQEHGQAGSVSLTVKVTPVRGSREQVTVTATIQQKLPKEEPSSSFFWTDSNGNLLRNDPNALEIPGLQVVETPPVREVTG